MRSFLEVSGLCSKSLFAVIEGTRLWPQIRKEILILPNLWTILHKMMEFRVRWQRRSPRGSEDVWVISEGAEWSVPSESWSLGLTAHSTSFCRRTPKGKSQTQFHGLLSWPSNSPARGRESILHLSSRGKGTAALGDPTPPFQGTWSLFSPWKLEFSAGTLKPWKKSPRNLLRLRAAPDHTLHRDFIRLLQWVYFWLTFSGKPQEIWWSISENTEMYAYPVHVREGSTSSLD